MQGFTTHNFHRQREIMKTLLFTLNASHAHTALGIRCLRDALLDAGLEASCYEATLKDHTNDVLAHLYEQNATIYGFSCYIWNLEQILALAADLKAIRPDRHIVLGGPEVSFDTERFTSLPFVSTVLTGEGEDAMVKLAALCAAGEELPKVMVGEPFADFLTGGIHYKKEETLSNLVYYESSRGCPFSCAFCLSGAANAHAVRAKSAETALAELLEFEQFSKPLTVKLVDRTFNFDRERAKTIWRGLLSERYTNCYHFEIAAHLLDEEAFQILSQFPVGKIRLEIGLQSTNQKTLAAIARHTDATTVLNAAKRLTACGNVHVHLDLIAGLPHEDLASFANSFDEAYFCCDVLQLGFLKLLHGTPLRRDAEQNGMIFSQKPPYTVLQTKWLSFDELARLHAVEELCERLRNGGRFARTLDLILPRRLTPFAFFDGFSHYLAQNAEKALHKLSQRELFVLLSRYLKATLPTSLHDAISEALRADFAAFEVRRPPYEL